MLFCPKCQQLEPTSSERNADGSVTHVCKKCGSAIPLRRDLTPGEVVAGFEIEGELGRGAMGIVYQARQTNLDREVAIKILSDDSASDEVYVERFFREARAAASLSHPNVVQAYDAGVTDDGIYYFVMEKVTGENLDLVLNNVGPLNIPQALDVFISVANALAYAWNRNQLSHGDIKPENIIMRLNGKVKLADFGLARRAKDPELADEDIRATPAYAPPEIIRGDNKDVPGFKSDMYSFGATAYHILIGHEPFVGTDPAKVCAMQLSDVQIPLSELNPNIPQRLSDLVDALMEKAPENRPANWDDVVAELRDIRRIMDETASESAPARGKRTKDGHRRGRGRMAQKRSSTTSALVVAVPVLVVAVAALVAVLCARSCANNTPRQTASSPPGGESSSPSSPVSSGSHESAPVLDEAYYRARWQTMNDNAGRSGLRLEEIERFVSEAGPLAPGEAIEKRDSLPLRNKLLDKAREFKPEDVEPMDAAQLAGLHDSVQSDYDELVRLDDSLSDHIFLLSQRQEIQAFLETIATIQLRKTLGGMGTVQPPTPASGKNASGVPEPDQPGTAAEGTGTEDAVSDRNAATARNMNSPQLRNYRYLMSNLPECIHDEARRADSLQRANTLLADRDFTDEAPRKNCAAIKRFLELNQAPLLPYLSDNEKALIGMRLFPKSYPDSQVDDVDIGKGTLSLSSTGAGGARVRMGIAWNKLRYEEGEDRIIVTLINSPQLSKFSETFREYLFVRALFLGVDPERLRVRFNSASGLSAAKKDELYSTADFFRKTVTIEENN